MRSLLPTFRRDERGVTIVLLALLIFVLLTFAGFAVDLGYQWAQRRQAQGAVDTGVLAASVTTFTSGGDLQAAVDDALVFTNNNTSWSLSAADWAACTDADELQWNAAELGLAPATSCISWNGAFSEMRVRLPTAQLDTFFAKVIGINTLPVMAAAQATLGLPESSETPPFVVLSNAGAGDQVCLRSSSSGPALPGQWIGNGVGSPAVQTTNADGNFVADPCDDLPGASQFFGTLDPYFYTDLVPSPPDTSCKSVQSSIDVGIALGIDHILGSFEPDWPGTPNPVRLEGQGCPGGPPQPFPNTMALQTGFTAQVLRCGVLSSRNGTCSSGPVADGTTWPPRFRSGPDPFDGTFAGEAMENRAPWSFLSFGAGSVPGSCSAVRNASGPWDYFDFKEEFIRCLQDWNPGDATLFSTDLLQSGRFAWIPQIAESNLASSPVHFNQFVPVYLHKLYQQGTSSGNPDPQCWSQAEGTTGNSGWYWHEAGQGFSCGKSNQNVDRIAAIVLDCAMLPDTVCTADTSNGNPGGIPVLEVRLSR